MQEYPPHETPHSILVTLSSTDTRFVPTPRLPQEIFIDFTMRDRREFSREHT